MKKVVIICEYKNFIFKNLKIIILNLKNFEID